MGPSSRLIVEPVNAKTRVPRTGDLSFFSFRVCQSAPIVTVLLHHGFDLGAHRKSSSLLLPSVLRHCGRDAISSHDYQEIVAPPAQINIKHLLHPPKYTATIYRGATRKNCRNATRAISFRERSSKEVSLRWRLAWRRASEAQMREAGCAGFYRSCEERTSSQSMISGELSGSEALWSRKPDFSVLRQPTLSREPALGSS